MLLIYPAGVSNGYIKFEKNIKNFWKNDSVGEFFSILYIPSKRDVLSLAHCRLWY